MAQLPEAPTYNMRICSDLSDLLTHLRNIGDRQGFKVENGKIAVAPMDDKGRNLEKLTHNGQYWAIVNQLEGKPATYILHGGNSGDLTFTFQTAGKWNLVEDEHSVSGEKRIYICAQLGPSLMWGKGTQIRLYVNKPKEG
ncbi:hypothetical protein KY325_00470 [Candidatus Woesearchaeota archaeon]|nr:hypothetical protein [Candidatus Woesearchaeota archaeon]MBW3017618.1 hypothetical protein [Candidatus Woesearchaeota archaeon]